MSKSPYPNYKRTYKIDINKARHIPYQWGRNQISLPIISINDVPTTEFKPFSERHVIKMFNQSAYLMRHLGTKAFIITEYLDNTGTPIATLYPTSDIVMHKNDWTHADSQAIKDLQKAQQRLTKKLSRTK